MNFFGIGALELLTIAVVALLVMGPEKLPGMARKLGAMLVQARRAINEAQTTFVADLEAAERQRNHGGGAKPAGRADAGDAAAPPKPASVEWEQRKPVGPVAH